MYVFTAKRMEENAYEVVQKTVAWLQRHEDGDPVFSRWNTTREQWTRISVDRYLVTAW